MRFLWSEELNNSTLCLSAGCVCGLSCQLLVTLFNIEHFLFFEQRERPLVSSVRSHHFCLFLLKL